ncbi:hypothetical protein [Methanoculleus sp. 10]|uniref:hypothetical protein n=1 Tax=Methanoculleus sp. 10 TaxID=430615 RepID=UPI0025CF8759|nr:hypothetical protein [Methanoculleus sp. 10]
METEVLLTLLVLAGAVILFATSVVRPHRALAGAAWIFLLSRELAEAGETFEARARAYLGQPALPRAGYAAAA